MPGAEQNQPQPARAPRPGPPALPADWSAWQILAGLGDSLAVVDLSYRLLWLREPLLEGDPLAGAAGRRSRTCYQVLAGRQAACPICPVRQVLDSGQAQTVERRIVLPQGRVLWREARAYPIRDAQGRLSLVARISFDISRRKHRQALSQGRWAALERALSQLAPPALEPPASGLEPTPPLTARELEILRLLAQGLRKPQIAGLLGLSPHTVKRHVDHIFAKLGVNDRAQAAVWAARQGLV